MAEKRNRSCSTCQFRQILKRNAETDRANKCLQPLPCTCSGPTRRFVNSVVENVPLRALLERHSAESKHKHVSSASDFSLLPSEAVIEIFTNLPIADRVRAAATCSSWRQLLFTPSLWRETTIRFSPLKRRRAIFFYENCWPYIHDLTIEIDCNIEFRTDLDECIKFLQLLRDSRGLKRLTLRQVNGMLVPDPNERKADRMREGDNISIFVLLGASISELCKSLPSLQHLSLGGFEDCVGYHIPVTVPLLGRKQADSIESLHLQSLRTFYGNFQELEYQYIRPLRNLRVLGLDRVALTDEFIHSLAQDPTMPLKRLVINLQPHPRNSPIRDESWAALVEAHPNLRVTLNVISARLFQAYEFLHSRLVPVDNLRLLYSQEQQDAHNRYGLTSVLHKVSKHLKAFTLMTEYEEGSKSAFDSQTCIFGLSRCPNLEYVNLTGVRVPAEGILSPVSVLRKVKTMVIPDACIPSINIGNGICYIDGVLAGRGYRHDVLFDRMSKALGRKWAPVPNSELPEVFWLAKKKDNDPFLKVRRLHRMYHHFLMEDQRWDPDC